VPVIKHHASVLVRGLRAFLSLEIGLVRDGVAPGPQVAGQDRKFAELRARSGKNGVKPENIVWIFGDGRTGSTWMMRMVDELDGQTLWREPMVGLLFGYLYYLWADEKRHHTKHFILGHNKESWLKSIRNFVLDEARTRFPDFKEDEYLVVKEPNGSIGAPLLMEALPESRMILLVRDPRDVVASSMDAHRKGSWHYERRNLHESLADEQPGVFVKRRAYKYLWYVGNSMRAYDDHRGPKVLVKYEDLRADTLGAMRRIYSALGVTVDERALSEAVKKHSWENVPEEEKGEGKFYRKASPGSWKEDLSPEHIEMVEQITAPLLKEFYSYEGESRSLSDELASSRQWMRMLYGP